MLCSRFTFGLDPLFAGPIVQSTQWDFLIPKEGGFGARSTGFSSLVFYIWIVWTIFWAFGLLMFVYRWYHGEPGIRMRGPILALISAIGAESAFTCQALQVGLGESRYPWVLETVYLWIFLPLFFIPFVLRFIRYILRSMFMESKGESSKVPPYWLNEAPFIAILGLAIGLLTAAWTIIHFAVAPSWVTAYGCEWRAATFWVLTAIGVICLVFVLVSLVKMRDVKDPYGVKRELVATFVVWLFADAAYVGLFAGVFQAREYLGLIMFAFLAAGYFSSIVIPIAQSFHAPPSEGPRPSMNTLDWMVRNPEALELLRRQARDGQKEELVEMVVAVSEYSTMCLSLPGPEHQQEKRETALRVVRVLFDGAAPINVLDPPAHRRRLVAEIEGRGDEPFRADLFKALDDQVRGMIISNGLFDQTRQLQAYTDLKTKMARQYRQNEGQRWGNPVPPSAGV